MDLRKLKKLIDLVEESGIAELELTEGEEKVKISRPFYPSLKGRPMSNIVLHDFDGLSVRTVQMAVSLRG